MKEIKKYYPNKPIREHYWVNENNKIEGEYKRWYKNGQTEIHCFYHNGLREGECKNWYENGQLAYHCFYKNGLFEGEYKIWYSSGQLNEHCFYKNGLSEGEFKRWYKDGQLKEHCFYHNNIEIDISTYVTDINNITEEEYFLLQITFGYFPLIKFNGTL